MKTSFEPFSVPLMIPENVQDANASRELAPATLTQIYDQHFDFVWRNARRLGVPDESADDVTQEVFIVVHRRLSSFNGSSLRAWIFGILLRKVSDHRRSYRRKRSRNVPLDIALGSEELSAIDVGANPTGWADNTESRLFLEKLLAALDEDKRTLLILAELEQWTLREIAELYGSNTSTIHCRLVAAKCAAEKVYARMQRGQEELP